MSKHYDLEDRTFRFAERVRAFTKAIPRSIENQEDVKQLVRASGSVGEEPTNIFGAIVRKSE